MNSHRQEIICANCGKAFTINKAGHADILKQVRDADFEKQLRAHHEFTEQEKQRAVELAEAKLAAKLADGSAKLEAEVAKKASEIELLQASIQNGQQAEQRAA